ncbi:SPOR domain-containing protein [Bradyrhizobium sp. AZCC 1693]|uniref:SPOR domain-containing protein n=1 Tax=Bradyrhizobium sp. AZCC 1693 TaxID=3117029 RepID=UPI002FF13BFF
MANRYQDRPFPSADEARGESDPLAELARLIGQNDPLGAPAKPAPRPLQSRANVRPQQEYDLPEEEPEAPPSPPAWMQRARHETPLPPPPLPQEYDQKYDDEPEYQQPAPVHPLHRYAAQPPQAPAQGYQAPAQDYDEAPQQYADEPQHDPSRYDDALYGRLETGEHDYQRDPAYPDDPYAYQGEYEEEPAPKKRSSGLMTVAAVLALAVVGTGAAFAYRTFVGSPRSGEPPIIRADNSPTKVVPAQSDASAAKNPDRMLPGDGGEKLVSREETPVDVNSRSGAPRVVFPPLNQNANPPPASSVSPSAPMPAAANGTMPNNEPRRVRTLAVKGDPADNGGIPAGASAPPPKPQTRSAAAPAAAPAAPPARNPASANASANAPMSLAPQASESEPQTRVAATNPTQTAPAGASEGGGSFLVSVTSQDSESAARESFRVAQGKYASVLGSRSPVIKRVDLADGKTKYRAMVGPYRTRQEAVQFCTELKAAGGQCFIP